MAALATVATETQFHVLAVDDSLIDRKLIERLLKTSSYQGILMSKPKGISWILYCFDLDFSIADIFLVLARFYSHCSGFRK